jgi:hypothetical protein
MILDGRTLILVAYGRRGRLFEEARRGGPLIERPDWIGSQGGTVHMFHPNRCDRAEADFLAQLLRRAERIFAEQAFDHLILIALKARIELSEPHDRLTASAEDIQQTVRALRRVNA